jgi:hypothetical protein
MEFYAPVTLEHGLNDVTFMDDNRTKELPNTVTIYLLKDNNYIPIGTLSSIRRNPGTQEITNSSGEYIGTIDELANGRLFIKISDYDNSLRGGKRRRRKTKRKTNKKRKTKRRQ